MKIYLVGGAIRDRLLGIKSYDKDFCVVGATPDELLKKGFSLVGKDFPVFLHPKTHEEYALARTEKKQGHGYTGFICDFNPNITIEEDLARRDLTVNAIAENEQHELIDPYNGIQDIKNKILRHIGPSFKEDPLRVLRLARFYARFKKYGFKVAPETMELCKEISASGELQHLTKERIWIETQKALTTDNPEAYFILLKEVNALKDIYPEIDALKNCSENLTYHPEGESFSHTMLTIKEICKLTKNPVTRFAMLLHDIGKIESSYDEQPFPYASHRIKARDVILRIKQYSKIPLDYINTAQAVALGHIYIGLTTRSAEELYDIYQYCGCFKEPFKIAILSQCITADYRGTLNQSNKKFYAPYFFTYMFNAAYKIKAESAIKLGFKGKDIGIKLRELRIEAIQKAQKYLIENFGDVK